MEDFPGVLLVGGHIHDWGYEEIGDSANGRWIPDVRDAGPAMDLRGYAKADQKTPERLALTWARTMQSGLRTFDVTSASDGSVTVRGTYTLPTMQQHDEPKTRNFSVRFGPDGRSQGASARNRQDAAPGADSTSTAFAMVPRERG